jgi:dynein light intermediate chain, axonemal
MSEQKQNESLVQYGTAILVSTST